MPKVLIPEVRIYATHDSILRFLPAPGDIHDHCLNDFFRRFLNGQRVLEIRQDLDRVVDGLTISNGVEKVHSSPRTLFIPFETEIYFYRGQMTHTTIAKGCSDSSYAGHIYVRLHGPYSNQVSQVEKKIGLAPNSCRSN